MLIFQSKSHNILRETYENFAIDTEIYNFFYGIVQNRCFLFEKKNSIKLFIIFELQFKYSYRIPKSSFQDFFFFRTLVFNKKLIY